jgi:hypothetical protein
LSWLANAAQDGRAATSKSAAVRCAYASTPGIDPVTGKQVYLRATIDGTDDKAWRKAEDKLAEFRTQVLKQHSASSSVTLSYAMDE